MILCHCHYGWTLRDVWWRCLFTCNNLRMVGLIFIRFEVDIMPLVATQTPIFNFLQLVIVICWMTKVMRWKGDPPPRCDGPWYLALTHDVTSDAIYQWSCKLQVLPGDMNYLITIGRLSMPSLMVLSVSDYVNYLCCSLSLAWLPNIMYWIICCYGSNRRKLFCWKKWIIENS